MNSEDGTMMRTPLRRWIAITTMAVAAWMAAPLNASAQGFVSPLIGYDFGGDSGCPEIATCEDRNLNVGVSVGSLGNILGSELEFAYAKNFFGEIPGVSSSVMTLMGNGLVAPRFGPAQPYFLIGLGLMKTNVEFSAASLLDNSTNHLAWDTGGGLIVFLGSNVGVRGEIRYFHAFQNLEVLGISLGETKLDFGRAAAGILFRF
jgi:opacity protein-like surface antigen